MEVEEHRIDISLTPFQSKMYRSLEDPRIRVVCANCGRRAGKSHMATTYSLIKLMRHNGYRIGFGVPNYAQILQTWQRLTAELPIIDQQNFSQKLITLLNGSSFEIHSLDNPDRIRGKFYDLFVVDEASSVRQLEYVINSVIRPTLADRKGKLLLISTPLGAANYFSKVYLKAKHDTSGTMAALNASTFDNPFIDPAELESLKLLPDIVFRTEIMAEILTDNSNPFGDIEAVVAPGSLAGKVAVYGLDLASRIDCTAIVGLSAEGNLLELHNMQTDWQQTKALIASKVNNIPTLADVTGIGGPVLSDLRAQYPKIQLTDFLFTQQSRQELLLNLAVGIKNKKIRIPNTQIRLIEQLKSFEYVVRENMVKYQCPNHMHDDDVIALALAYKHLTSKSQFSVSGVITSLRR